MFSIKHPIQLGYLVFDRPWPQGCAKPSLPIDDSIPIPLFCMSRLKV